MGTESFILNDYTRLIGQGSAVDTRFGVQIKVTINANGLLVVDRFRTRDTCGECLPRGPARRTAQGQGRNAYPSLTKKVRLRRVRVNSSVPRLVSEYPRNATVCGLSL